MKRTFEMDVLICECGAERELIRVHHGPNGGAPDPATPGLARRAAGLDARTCTAAARLRDLSEESGSGPETLVEGASGQRRSTPTDGWLPIRKTGSIESGQGEAARGVGKVVG